MNDKTLKKSTETEREEMCQIIKANNGVKADWMRRIDESFRNSPGCNENSPSN